MQINAGTRKAKDVRDKLLFVATAFCLPEMYSFLATLYIMQPMSTLSSAQLDAGEDCLT